MHGYAIVNELVNSVENFMHDANGIITDVPI